MDLTVAIAQCNISWEHTSENLNRISQLLEKDANLSNAQLLVLPEMFATGFSMESHKIAQDANGEILQWLKETAKRFDVAILAGVAMITDLEDQIKNNAVWVSPVGDVADVAKRHLFRVAGEHKSYVAGTAKKIIPLQGWRLFPLVCYDLRFPAWSRNVQWHGDNPDYAYDCVFYIANWPQSRREHWLHLLRARAIENQSYVIGVNRVGTDAKGYEYSGDSVVFCPKGTLIHQCQPNAEEIAMVSLDSEFLSSYRKRFPFVLDADKFEIQ